MNDRWNDERAYRERAWRERDEDRYDVFGLNDERDRERPRYRDGEERSFGDRGRVFGERDTGAGYNRPPGEMRRPDWQDRDYGGMSPAMRRGGYAADDRASRGFARRDDGERGGGARHVDERWASEMRRPAIGGTGGYDYDRGYGDAGRGRDGSRYGRDDHDGFEEAAHDAGSFFRRTGEKIADWFSGESDHRGRGPKGYKRSDERINEEIHERLTDDPWLDASEISCAVSDGEVTLSGVVGHREAKHRAERIVENLSGVKHVQNNLRVQASGFGQAAASRHDPVKDVTDGEAAKPHGLLGRDDNDSTRPRRN